MPKFIISKSKVMEQYNKISNYGDIISYSSKTNPLISQILEGNTDCLFSIHLLNELKTIKDKSRVIFLAQGWNKDIIEELIGMGIRWFVVDNESDLDVLVDCLSSNDASINLLLRVKLKERSIKTERYFVFGMNSEIVNMRIRELRNNEKINQIGVHFHRKTQNMSEWNLKYEINDILEEDVLQMIDVVNIGGGLPSEYANTNVDVIKAVFNKIEEFREFLKEKNIKLMVEPGRFIAAPAGKLITEIIGIYDNNIIVNASVYNTDMDAIIVPVKLLVEGEGSYGKPYVIKGMTPCSMDIFRYRVYLKDPKVGDSIIFLNAGAYNFSSDFCSLEKVYSEIIE